MKIKEGPAFGAAIIGFGIGYLLYQKTSNLALSVFASLALAIMDYVLLVWISDIKKKKK